MRTINIIGENSNESSELYATNAFLQLFFYRTCYLSSNVRDVNCYIILESASIVFDFASGKTLIFSLFFCTVRKVYKPIKSSFTGIWADISSLLDSNWFFFFCLFYSTDCVLFDKAVRTFLTPLVSIPTRFTFSRQIFRKILSSDCTFAGRNLSLQLPSNQTDLNHCV